MAFWTMFLLSYIAAPPTIGSAARAGPMNVQATSAVAANNSIFLTNRLLGFATGIGLPAAGVATPLQRARVPIGSSVRKYIKMTWRHRTVTVPHLDVSNFAQCIF
jgi:hypothetical protein